jgi:thymidylate kinase
LLVSFSGLDGAGKSTQIENLRRCLSAQGYSLRLLTFWDDVVVFSSHRENFVHKVYKSERGIGAPGKPVERRDKNMRQWYLSLFRHGLYLADALNLAWVVTRARRSADVLIVDRYIYDEWANLPLVNRLTRWYVRLLEMIVPCPDVAFLLDADPATARARKPEYPIEFMQQCRSSYRDLALLLTNIITVIPPLPLDEAKQRVENLFWMMTGRTPSYAKPETQELDRTTAA